MVAERSDGPKVAGKGYGILMAYFRALLRRARSRHVQRAMLALLLACAMGTAAAVLAANRRSAVATARLNSAALELDALTGGSPDSDQRRAAIAWGYAERLRLGLESPFRLIDAAARDPRLKSEERRTVSWALLAHVLRGESHHIDAAALDLLGPTVDGKSAIGEQHLELITDIVTRSDNPRAAELAIRMAYTLAAAERLVEGAAPQLAAEAAALLADREIARREAGIIVRSAGATNPIDEIRRRRARRSFYVERPVLFEPGERIEREAIALIRPALEWLRVMTPETLAQRDSVSRSEAPASDFAATLLAAGALLPPEAPLVVTVRRYAPIARTQAPGLDQSVLSHVHNAEMLAAVANVPAGERLQHRAIGRLLLASAVAKRSLAQERVWFAGDSGATVDETVAALGLASLSFDRDVPRTWQGYYLRQLEDGVRDLRRVLPTLSLDAVQIRFRMSAPADSALAMHDPRSRTVHLPVMTAGGTLSHELAHDLDRRSAADLGVSGYRSDNVARSASAAPRSSGSGRLAASLRALTDEVTDQARLTRTQADRPAEIFATRVDWFVARALARQGISSGYLSAVQDEWLTGHVVHVDRLRNSARSRLLLTALTEMTPVAPFAAEEREPSVQTLLRWSLAGPVDRRVAAEILRNDQELLALPWLVSEHTCDDDDGDRAALIRMAAESRARGWLRLRARWMSDTSRAPWARSALGQGPWAVELADRRIAELSDYVLVQLTADQELSAGLAAYAAPLVARARCN